MTICAVLLAGCATPTAPPTEVAAGPPPIRVGMTPNVPPIAYVDQKGLQGIEPDFARALGERLGRPIEFVELDWEDQINALLRGQTDVIMSGMSITRARKARVMFIAPYLQAGHSALIRRSDQKKYGRGPSPFLLDARVGLLQGTTGDLLVQDKLPVIERLYLPSAQAGADAVASGQIDLFVHDVPVIWYLASVYEAQGLIPLPSTLSVEWLAWAVRPDDVDLLLSLNRALRDWNEDGTLDSILWRWLPGMYQKPQGDR